MDITLEKIDAVRERTGVSYQKAREALEACNGDVLEALIYLENAQQSQGKWTETMTVAGSEVIDNIKDIIRQGNVTKIRVKKDDKVILDIPITAGAIGTLLAPQLAAVGVVVAMISKCTLEIERPDKKVMNVNEVMGQKAGKAMEFVEDFTDEAKEFIEEFGKKVKKTKNTEESIDKDE